MFYRTRRRGRRYHRVVPLVTMYSRNRCGLCDRARAVIEQVRSTTAFDFEEVLIDGDDELESEYGVRVPVVAVDGQERFEYEVDPGELASFVGARSSRGRGLFRRFRGDTLRL